MANQYYKYSSTATFSETMYRIFSAMMANGWIHQGSGCTGSGTRPGDTGTTDYSVQAGNEYNRCDSSFMFSQYNSWIVLRSPDGQREILFYRGTYSTFGKMAYSYSDHFIGGTGVPSPTNPPIATDAQWFAGGASSYKTMAPADGTYRLKIMVQDAAPYGWWVFGHPSGGGLGYIELFMDPMKAGSYPTEDVDPYVFGFNEAANAQAYICIRLSDESMGLSAQGIPACYLKKGLSGEGWVTMQACYLTNYNNAPVGYGGGSPVNPHNGKDELFPVVWDRRSALTAPTGYKGVSSLFQWLGTSRSVGDTITKITSKDKIVIGHLIADWDGTLPEV